MTRVYLMSLEAAARHLQEALRLRRIQQDTRGLAETLTNLGIVAQMQQNLPQGRKQQDRDQ